MEKIDGFMITASECADDTETQVPELILKKHGPMRTSDTPNAKSLKDWRAEDTVNGVAMKRSNTDGYCMCGRSSRNLYPECWNKHLGISADEYKKNSRMCMPCLKKKCEKGDFQIINQGALVKSGLTRTQVKKIDDTHIRSGGLAFGECVLVVNGTDYCCGKMPIIKPKKGKAKV